MNRIQYGVHTKKWYRYWMSVAFSGLCIPFLLACLECNNSVVVQACDQAPACSIRNNIQLLLVGLRPIGMVHKCQ